MTIFQILAVFFALFMMYVMFIHSKKKTLTAMEVSFWYSLWSFFIVIALFPNLLIGIAGVLHFARVFDLLVVLAFMVLSVIIFFSYFAQKEIKYKLSQLVGDLAIADAQSAQKKRKKKSRK